MLLRKTAWFWKSGLAVISFVLMFSISGCSDTPPEEDTVSETVIDVQDVSEEEQENEEEIINICIDLYDKAAEENKLDDLEIIRSIVNRLGENEYPAVDSRNQVNMTEAEQVLEFCEKVDTQEEADITILEVGYLGGFVKYDLHTKDGNVDVVRSYYGYENGEIQKEVTGRYQAEYWNYTEEGYLMFSGVWFSEELYVLTLSGAEEHTALRVQPLDETYRELSRKYLLPISFEQNNMFIVDWSEEDFGDLNFYDMYDILYPKVNGQYVPYVADDNLSVSAVYRIPKEEFESVIMKYFNIDSETLQSKTVYDSEDSTYEYKPRGFEEVEYPEYPYSEVIGYTENSDGTITLTANVVFPYSGNSKVYAHEVVVRPLEDGGVQYVSNRIIPSEDNSEETWHTPRLTLEEWEDLLGPSEVKGKSQFKLLMERLPEEHKARWLSGAALNTSDQAMASVLSTALSRLNAFLDSEIEQLLCFETKINTEKFCRNKSAVFLIMPEEDDSKYFLISLIVQQLYREMLSIADEMGGKLPNRVMFFLDEFGTLPAIQSAEMMFSASRSRRISFVPIIQSLAQLEKNYGKEGADIIIDNCQVCIYGGFAPNSEAANVLSKTLGDRTVMTGSISQGRDKSKSLQMTGRPLMTPDELKIMPKDTFIVTRTGVKPMKTKLKLFFEWGIELNETYPMRQAVVRKVHYANKKTIEEAIAKKYGLPQNPLQQPVKRPMQEQDKPLCNISKTMKGVEKSYD